jgi:hypothetical protein
MRQSIPATPWQTYMPLLCLSSSAIRRRIFCDAFTALFPVPGGRLDLEVEPLSYIDQEDVCYIFCALNCPQDCLLGDMSPKLPFGW